MYGVNKDGTLLASRDAKAEQAMYVDDSRALGG